MMRSAVLVTTTLIAAAIGTVSFAATALTKVDEAATVTSKAFRIDPGPPVPETSSGRASAEILRLVNAERNGRGLTFLFSNNAVSAAAQAHAADMAAHRTLVHEGSDGSSAGDRLARTGFVWKDWGEAIAAGYATPAAVFNGWMESPPHRKYLLGDFTYVGVGVAAASDNTPYWDLIVAK